MRLSIAALSVMGLVVGGCASESTGRDEKSNGRAVAVGPSIATETVSATQIAAGRDIVVARCASCHAIDAAEDSPNPDAPPLKYALWKFHEEGLATHFIDAVRVGHGDMPVFDFNPVGTDALIAYLKTIKSAHEPEDQ